MRIDFVKLSALSVLLAFSRSTHGDSTPGAIPASDCNVERAGTEAFGDRPLVLGQSASTDLSGWVVDVASGEVPFELWVSLGSDRSRVEVPVRHRVFRPDVVTHFKNDKLILAGFVARVSARTLGVGTWRISLRYRSRNGDRVCDNGRTLIVRAEDQ